MQGVENTGPEQHSHHNLRWICELQSESCLEGFLTELNVFDVENHGANVSEYEIIHDQQKPDASCNGEAKH